MHVNIFELRKDFLVLVRINPADLHYWYGASEAGVVKQVWFLPEDRTTPDFASVTWEGFGPGQWVWLGTASECGQPCFYHWQAQG